MANSIQRQALGIISYAQQTALNVPASGASTILPIRTGHGEMTMTPVPSMLIRGDGQSVRGRHGSQRVKGSYKSEMMWGHFDAILEAVMRGTWAAGGTLGDILINPTAGNLVRRYFTLEEYEEDLLQSEVYPDIIFDTLNLSMKPDNMVELDISFMGTGAVLALDQTTTPTSPNFTAPVSAVAATVPMSAANAVLELSNLGVVLDLMSWSLKIDLKATAPAVCASRFAPDVFDGVIQVGGSMTLMRRDLEPFKAAIAETPVTMSMLLSTPGDTPQQLKFTIPQFTFGSATKSDFKRDGGPLEVTIPFPDALVGFDDRGGANPPTTLIIERTAA